MMFFRSETAPLEGLFLLHRINESLHPVCGVGAHGVCHMPVLVEGKSC